MGRAAFVVWAVVVICTAVVAKNDDDFGFENNEEFQVELTANHSEITRNGLKRLWGVPDTTAYAEHLFRMEIPREAFTGEVSAYKVRRENGSPIPPWMAVDTRHGIITGVPQEQDVGAHVFQVTAHGKTHGLTATDTFTIDVKHASEKTHSKLGVCSGQQKRLLAAIVIDRPMQRIPHKQRIKALMGLAHFLAVDGDELRMSPYKPDSANLQTVMSGAGDSRGRRDARDGFTGIYWNVGCGGSVWAGQQAAVAGAREQARDGSLSGAARLPVAGWRLLAAAPPTRLKRQSDDLDGLGSGDGEGDGYEDEYDDEEDYSGDYDDDEYTRIDLPTARVNPAIHPHRHHHGEVTDNQPPTDPTTQPTTEYTEPTTQTSTESPTKPTPPLTDPTPPPSYPTPPPSYPTPPPSYPTMSPSNPTISPSNSTMSSSHPTQPETSDPTSAEITDDGTTMSVSTNSYTTENHKVQITPYSETASEANSIINMTAIPQEVVPRRLDEPIVIVPEEMTTSTEAEQTVIILPANELPLAPSSESSSTMVASPSPTTTETQTTPRPTTRETTPTTLIVSSTISTVPTTTPTVPTTTPTIPTTTPSVPSTTPTTISSTTVQMTTPILIPETTTEEEEEEIEEEEEEETEVTEKDSVSSTERTSTIIGRTTETVTFAMPVNQPPTLNHHMKKLAITAGKAFRYIIPADLFTDPEEGTNLTFTMYENDNTPLSADSWIQFIPSEREVYGLPLEAHVSRWHFAVEARDSAGLAARGPLDITVQQHKQHRTVNHQFILEFDVVYPYNNSVEWQVRALEGIVNLFRDTDMDHLTVLAATRNGRTATLTYTNDTLPRDSRCPLEDINRLMSILEWNGAASPSLVRAMLPQLKVSAVSWRGSGRCAARGSGSGAPDTYPPVTRNQVDHVTATVGQLLAYKVQEDTFFDPEDGGTRNLRLSLRRGDRSPLPAAHWLQFDDNNQEFYGLPLAGDEGSQNYQLIAEDSSKKSAYDSLVVEVVKAPTIRPTVEFQMIMEYPYENLVNNAANKRKVVEKLAAMFGQTKTDSIRIKSITENPTTIIWYNTSLPMDHCPKKEIDNLRQMIINDERATTGESALKHVVDQIFDKDFNVMAIRLVPLGLCAEQNTRMTKAGIPPTLPGHKAAAAPPGSAGYSEYLVTYVIPAVVVVAMLLMAALIACLLYRRRRTGKMSVGDEEERQAFRSKGIPVIFQDELEERTDSEPVHKSPVIMREEKPPLLPPAPDYRGSEDAPYRPPPPFASSRTPPRPKATPTYRKPPPYVPP